MRKRLRKHWERDKKEIKNKLLRTESKRGERGERWRERTVHDRIDEGAVFETKKES
jgi:hypothetical protein